MHYYLFLCFLMISSFSQAQVIIHTEHCNKLIVGIDNYLHVHSTIGKPIEKVKAFLSTPSRFSNGIPPQEISIKKTGDNYSIHLDSIGVLYLHIIMGKDTIQKEIPLKYIQAVCRVGTYKANSDKKISAETLQSQLGVSAIIECCGFDAKCAVDSFEVIYINNRGTATYSSNKGARFSEDTQALLKKAKSGDIYIFRKIYYRCPATPTQRGEDIILEIE